MEASPRCLLLASTMMHAGAVSSFTRCALVNQPPTPPTAKLTRFRTTPRSSRSSVDTVVASKQEGECSKTQRGRRREAAAGTGRVPIQALKLLLPCDLGPQALPPGNAFRARTERVVKSKLPRHHASFADGYPSQPPHHLPRLPTPHLIHLTHHPTPHITQGRPWRRDDPPAHPHGHHGSSSSSLWSC